MKFLLTNDDGIGARGLESLRAAAEPLGTCTVVAPLEAHSGCSHRVTTEGPIRLEQRGRSEFAVEGTPADCVRVALARLARDANWVLAGINAGGNLGADVYHSGTVAAAREAVLHGWPAIAVSHYRKAGREIDWDRAARWTAPLIAQLTAQPHEPGVFWNVNLPHLAPDDPDPEVIECRLDPTPLPLEFRVDGDALHYHGVYHLRRRIPGCDVDVCFSGSIALTRLRLF